MKGAIKECRNPDFIHRDSKGNLQSSAEARMSKDHEEMQEKLLSLCQNKETNGDSLLNRVGTTVEGMDKVRMPSIPNIGTDNF